MQVNSSVALVACQRCKLAKRRCDHGHPKCSGCSKANAACIILDPLTGRRYSRQYVGDLEAEEKALQARVDRDSTSPQQSMITSPSSAADRRTGSSESPKAAGDYVGDNGGLSLLRSIFSGGEWNTQREALRKATAERPQMPELNMTANEAPMFDEAFALLNNYFSRFHIHHSFLLRDDVFVTFDKVYSSSGTASCMPQDRFRLFMIFAISGVTRYRAGLSRDHPYGYYLAALHWIDRVPILGSADAIQNLLLVARFGMYYHVGISLWDISRSCMRQCIELDYHVPSSTSLTPFEEQKRRRIFWECYILDRYSSGILGRPFAIADEEISIELPIATNDEVFETTQASSLSSIAPSSPQMPSELSVFVFCIKLRRISSRIRTEMYRVRERGHRNGLATTWAVSAAGHAQVKVDQYLHELESWRREAPIFANPASLYERPEWHDYLLEADKLALLRAAMHASPKRRNSRPPSRLLRLNLQSAARVIDLYAEMFERHLITWTRNYFQTIFIAGISIIHGLSFGPTDPDYVADADRFWPTLNVCAKILTIFGREMPDAGMFATIFTETKKQLLQKRPTSQAIAKDMRLHTDETRHGTQYEAAAHMLTQPLPAPSTGNESFSVAGDFGSLQQLEQDLFFSEDLMQSIEAGLGQYACGFQEEEIFTFDFPEAGF